MSNAQLIRKALSVAVPGQSLSGYLPDPLAEEVIKFIRDINIMRRLLPTFKMNSRTWKKPKNTSGMSAYYIPDGVTATLTSYSTTQIEWIAKKLMSFAMIDEEAIEDSQPDVLNQVLEEFALAMAEAEEMAFLSGDPTHTATAPTPDAATEANWYVRDPRLMFEGVFTVASSGEASTAVDASGGTFTEDMVNEALFNLGKYGRNKRNLFGVVPSVQAANMRQNEKLKKANESGLALASFITGLGSAGEGDGLVTQFYGIPFYEAPFAPTDQIAIMHNRAAEIGDRRMIKTETDRVIESDQRKYVSSERIAFQFNYRDATVAITDLDTTVSF